MALPTDEEKKKLLLKSLSPIPQTTIGMGAGPTLDKTFPNNLSPFGVFGTPYKSDFTPASNSAPASEPDKESLFGSPMRERSNSSLMGGTGTVESSGSRSSLNAPARALGTESGAMRTEARRLRRQGYGDAAQSMALEASKARLKEPKILTQAQRGAQAVQAQEVGMAAQEAAAAQREEAQYLRDLYKRGRADLANQ